MADPERPIAVMKCWACGEHFVFVPGHSYEPWACRRCFVKERAGNDYTLNDLVGVMVEGCIYVWAEREVKRRRGRVRVS
jgi:hypothetical protein